MAETPEADARPLGDVLERPSPRLRYSLFPFEVVGASSGKLRVRGEVEVEPAVAIVVEHGHARAVGRRIIFIRALPLTWVNEIPAEGSTSRNRIVELPSREPLPTPGRHMHPGDRRS